MFTCCALLKLKVTIYLKHSLFCTFINIVNGAFLRSKSKLCLHQAFAAAAASCQPTHCTYGTLPVAQATTTSAAVAPASY